MSSKNYIFLRIVQKYKCKTWKKVLAIARLPFPVAVNFTAVLPVAIRNLFKDRIPTSVQYSYATMQLEFWL